MTSVRDPLVGHALDGRYDITERLARGGMATVYRAIDRRLGREVAIKVMHEGLGDDAEFAAKFDAEARAAARLSSPHVVSVFDQGTDNHRPYIVMEYVPGMTLRQLIVKDAPMDPLRMLGLIEPVLAALSSAHDAGLVHRDVKPENVLISDRGQLKVADFGLARAITSQSATASQGILIGTVSYLPPELVMARRADTRSDVYSVGVMMWEMLTGTKPHVGDTPIQVAYAHVHEDIPPPSQRARARIPGYVDALVRAATRRDPDQRPRDAEVLLAMVHEARETLSSAVFDDPELADQFATIRSVSTRPASPDSSAAAPTAPVPTSAPSALSATSPAEHTPTVTNSSWPPVRLSPERHYRRRRRLIGIIVLVLMLAGSTAYGSWWFTTGRYTTIPHVQNLDRDTAARTATEAGLQPTFDEAWSEDVPAGTVISTDPASGADIVRGSTVEIVMSRGPERFTVPTIIGLGVDDATTALQHIELTVGTVTEVYDEKVPAGQVMKASIAAGSKVKRNTAVDLTASKGRRPIAVQNYAGADADDAAAQARKAGFTVKVTTAHSKTVAAGKVIRQDPAKGTRFRGDAITITKSLGPVMVTIPNTKGMGVAEAKKLLVDKGFTVTTKPVKENHLGLGYVSYSEPGIAAKAPEGSTIVLYLV